jgi:hypothetical protein
MVSVLRAETEGSESMKSTPSTIEADTVLIPELIADRVAHDLALYLHDFHGYTPSTHPDHLVVFLTKRAQQVYTANKDFRKKLQSSRGNRSRDTLYAFMRHWSAAYAKDNWPGAFKLLPSGYTVGTELPKKRKSCG